MFNLITIAKYFKALLCRDMNRAEEAMQLVNDSLAIIQRYNNQAKILYVLFEKLYIQLAEEQNLTFVDIESEEYKIANYTEKLKALLV